MKIALIGYNATGKTTLGLEIARRLSIAHMSLDDVRYSLDGEESNLEEAVKRVEAFLDNNDSWVIDGNQPRLSERRKLDEADIIILFDFNRIQSLKWAIKRHRENKRKGLEKPREKVGYDYILYTLHGGRTWRQRAHWNRILTRHKDKTIVLKKPCDIDSLLNGRFSLKERDSIQSDIEP